MMKKCLWIFFTILCFQSCTKSKIKFDGVYYNLVPYGVTTIMCFYDDGIVYQGGTNGIYDSETGLFEEIKSENYREKYSKNNRTNLFEEGLLNYEIAGNKIFMKYEHIYTFDEALWGKENTHIFNGTVKTYRNINGKIFPNKLIVNIIFGQILESENLSDSYETINENIEYIYYKW